MKKEEIDNTYNSIKKIENGEIKLKKEGNNERKKLIKEKQDG